MWILLIVGIILVIIILIPFVAYYTGVWKPATLDQTIIATSSTSYNIPSAWTSALPVKDSSCLVYTFVGVDNNVPQPSIQALDVASTTIQPVQGTCTDDDQIFAQKMYHICEFGNFQNIAITQFNGCPTIDGTFTKVNGYYEEYFNICSNAPSSQTANTSTSNSVTSSNSTRCSGSVGLIMYNYQSSVAGGFCLREPVYEVDGSNVIVAPAAPLLIAVTPTVPIPPTGIYPDPSIGCSISDTQHGFPAQLFRVVRSTYNGTTFTIDDSGNFCNIVHRPSGKYVAPYVLSSDGITALVVKFIPAFNPILIPANSFNGNGNWWYLTAAMTMPTELIRGIRPNPDPMLPSTIVGGPDWDGLYWADQIRAANPQIVWAPDPNPIYALQSPLDIWNYFTSTTNIIYSMVPFIVNPDLTPDFSAMSMTPFLTYPLITGMPADDVLPVTNPASIYYPTYLGLQAYATANSINPGSQCLGYNSTAGGYFVPAPLDPTQQIFVPISWTTPCAQEYVKELTAQYEVAISGAQERILSEYGSFQYVDLALFPTIMQGVSSFFMSSSS